MRTRWRKSESWKWVPYGDPYGDPVAYQDRTAEIDIDDDLHIVANYCVGLLLTDDNWDNISILQLRETNAQGRNYDLYDFIWTAPAELRSDAVKIIQQLSIGTAFAEDTWD